MAENEKTEKTNDSTKPMFSVTLKDKDGYVGSAWMNKGKYGNYISVKANKDIPKGSTVYINPRKGYDVSQKEVKE